MCKLSLQSMLALNEGARGGGNAEEGTILLSSPGTPLCPSLPISKPKMFNRKREGTKHQSGLSQWQSIL